VEIGWRDNLSRESAMTFAADRLLSVRTDASKRISLSDARFDYSIPHARSWLR